MGLGMTTVDCNVKVERVDGEEAVLVYQPGGGSDIRPGFFQVAITTTAAEIVKPGAVLKLTLENA